MCWRRSKSVRFAIPSSSLRPNGKSYSTSAQPAANRVDIYGEAIPLPAGTTTDKGILMETKDGKYSLKLNKYETAVTNASSGGLPAGVQLTPGQGTPLTVVTTADGANTSICRSWP